MADDDPRAVLQGWHRRDERGRRGSIRRSGTSRRRRSGYPLFELLGGPVRDRVRTYVNLGSELGGDARHPEAWADAARAACEDGFDAMKVYPAAPARPLEGSSYVRDTEELVRTVREAVGDDADVMVDLHGRTSPSTAIELGRALEPLRPWWLEEPCQPGNVEATAEVARALPIPIATGERLATGHEFRAYLDARACAVIQPNACYCGGISGFRRIAALAETAQVAIAPHNPNGPIGTMVSVHLALALPNVLILEQVRSDVPWRAEIVDHPIEIDWRATSTRPRDPGSASSSSKRSRRHIREDPLRRICIALPTARSWTGRTGHDHARRTGGARDRRRARHRQRVRRAAAGGRRSGGVRATSTSTPARMPPRRSSADRLRSSSCRRT